MKAAWGRILAVPLMGLVLWSEAAAIDGEGERGPDATSQAMGRPDSKVPSPTVPPPKPYGFRQAGYDLRYLVRRPAHLDRRDKILLTAAVATAGTLFLLRDEIRDWAQEHRTESRSEFLQDVRTMGKGAFAPALALVFYGSSFATRKDREKETALLLVESAGISYVTALLGSTVLAVERPEDGDSVQFFDFDGHGVSVDAALAASIVPPLRCQYLRIRPEDGGGKRFWKRFATGLLYTGAALTAYQRIDQDKHWAPDAFLGMATGLAVGEILCEAHSGPGRAGADGPAGQRVALSLRPDGIAFTFRVGRGARRGPLGPAARRGGVTGQSPGPVRRGGPLWPRPGSR